MDKNKILEALYRADAALDKMEVKGQNVFFLAAARQQMKIAYDALTTQEGGEQDA